MIQRKPFVPGRLEEDREQGADFVTIRLNKEDRARLDKYKLDNGIIKDSSAYKDALIIAGNVTHGRDMTPKTSTSIKKKASKSGQEPQNI